MLNAVILGLMTSWILGWLISVGREYKNNFSTPTRKGINPGNPGGYLNFIGTQVYHPSEPHNGFANNKMDLKAGMFSVAMWSDIKGKTELYPAIVGTLRLKRSTKPLTGTTAVVFDNQRLQRLGFGLPDLPPGALDAYVANEHVSPFSYR